MDTDRKWIIVRVDGKLAGISQDYGRLAEISARIAQEYRISGNDSRSSAPKSRKTGPRKKTGNGKGLPYGDITAKAATFEEIWALRDSVQWEDLLLFGTEFQKRVWKTLWEHTHPKTDKTQNRRLLLSYTDFADLCDNRSGVRAVAHAIGMNPLPVLIPCHLVVPKEAVDRISEIHQKAESTIFRGEDLCRATILNDNAIDFGEYALGRDLKHRLISKEIPNP